MLGEDNQDTLKSMHSLLVILEEESHYPEAEKLGARWWICASAVLVLKIEVPCRRCSSWPLILAEEGRYNDAEQLNRNAARNRPPQVRAKGTVTIDAASNLAIDLAYQGQIPEAESAVSPSFSRWTGTPSAPDNPKTLAAEGNLGCDSPAGGELWRGGKNLE